MGAVVKPDMVGKSEPVALAAKTALLERISQLDLPANFLDELVDSLGGAAAVAEMTGRKGRIVRNKAGHGVFELRAKPDSAEMDSLNVKETGQNVSLHPACTQMLASNMPKAQRRSCLTYDSVPVLQ